MNQLAFPIPLNHTSRFENFFWQNNTVLHETLLNSLSLSSETEKIFYLWGDSGSGKSHLLQASCHFLDLAPCVYLPLQQLMPLGPEILDDIELLHLIAIDDLELIAGNRLWEESIFHCYNRVLSQENTRLIFAANQPIAALNIQLPDLLSRLSASMVFHVNALDEAACLTLLEKRATEHGLTLPEDVAHFLIRRFPRNPGKLVDIFEKLDTAAWQEQHRLTIPFVKKILSL